MNTVGTSGGEGLHSPGHGVLHGGRAWDASADLIGQALKIAFQRRRLQGGLNYAIGFVSVGRRRCSKAGKNKNSSEEQGLHSLHMG
jgi:hypothetical protein